MGSRPWPNRATTSKRMFRSPKQNRSPQCPLVVSVVPERKRFGRRTVSPVSQCKKLTAAKLTKIRTTEHRMKRSVWLYTALISIVSVTAAVGAERTVCFRLRLADGRYNCPDATEAGARRPANPGGYVDAVGHQVE